MLRKFVIFVLLFAVSVTGLSVGSIKVARAALADPLNNSSFEQAGAVANKAYDWQDFGTGYNRVPGGRTGSWAIQLQNNSTSGMSGAYQRIDLAQTTQAPVFVGAYVKGANIVKAPGSYFGASLYAEIHLKNGQTAYWNTAANSGSFDWRWIGFNTAGIATVTGPIDYIFVIPALINASGNAYFDDLTVQDYVPTQSAVTLMFDDGPRNTFGQAKPVLDAYGYKGTAAIITSNIGQRGFMSSAQITTLYNAGWEIVSHSVTHSDMTAMTEAQALAEFTNSKNVLSAYGVKNFAYPFGAYSGNLNALGSPLYTSMRGFEQGSNAQGTYPYDVKVRAVTTQTTNADITGWLADAKENKRWVVLVFHDITNSGPDIYHTTPAQFRQMIQLVNASGVAVKTYDEALRQFIAVQ